jgi:hypothetical protein
MVGVSQDGGTQEFPPDLFAGSLNVAAASAAIRHDVIATRRQRR